MKVERPCGDRESRVGGGGKDDVDVELLKKGENGCFSLLSV